MLSEVAREAVVHRAAPAGRRCSSTARPTSRRPATVVSRPDTRCSTALDESLVTVRPSGRGVVWGGGTVGDGFASQGRPASQAALARSHSATSVVSVTPGGRVFRQPPAVAYGPDPVHTTQTFR